jgi:hypothetical protein
MYRSRRRFVAPLVIIPGPKEPKNIYPYVEGIMSAMAACGPGGAFSGCGV